MTDLWGRLPFASRRGSVARASDEPDELEPIPDGGVREELSRGPDPVALYFAVYSVMIGLSVILGAAIALASGGDPNAGAALVTVTFWLAERVAAYRLTGEVFGIPTGVVR